MARSRPAGSAPRIAAAALGAFCILFVLVAARPAAAATLSGDVRDQDGKPLAFASVVVVGTPYGAGTDESGRFSITLPPGDYSIQASFVGYRAETRQVRLGEGGAKLAFTLQEEARLLGEIEVLGAQKMVDVKAASTVRTIEREEILRMPVDEVLEVVGRQVGVSIYDDQTHIRGGREDEVVYVIDGVVVKDYITGQSRAGDLSARSVAEVNVLTGGFPSEYGQALSGIVNITTREGGTETRGYLSWVTDHVGGGWDGFRSDNVSMQFEGPLFDRGEVRVPGQLTYFVELSGRLSDTYLPGWASSTGDGKARVSSYEDKFLGQLFSYGTPFDSRSGNDWQLLTKFAWKTSRDDKFLFTVNKVLNINSGYFFDPIARVDPTANTTYPWEWYRRLDHYLTYTEDKNTLSGVWNHLTSESTLHELRLSRFFTTYHYDVHGKPWYDYEEPDDQALPPGEDHPFFIQTGDNPSWHDHSILEWALDWDMTAKRGKHTFKTGVNHSFQSIQYIDINYPWQSDPDGLGGVHDLYDAHPQVGAGYAQMQFAYEGLVGNVGLRFDYWYPGPEVEEAIADTSRPAITPSMVAAFEEDTFTLFGHHLKGRLSPRLSVSHPVTDRDKLFFNYGRFSQWPTYFYVYSKIGSVSSEEFPLIGNINLDPEVSSQWEFGAARTFSERLAGNITFFFKDQYDYPTATRFSRLGHGDFFIYRNSDYARTRGIEFEVERRPAPHLGGSISYSYSVSTGRSSDPNEAVELQELLGAAGQIGLEEGYTYWNRPHQVNLSLDYVIPRGDRGPEVFGLRIPDDLTANLYYSVRSGRAYTPEDGSGNRIGKRYSRNASFEHLVDVKIQRGFDLSRTRLALQLDIRNLFNNRSPRRIDPQTGEKPEDGSGEYSDPPASESSAEYRAAQLDNPSYLTTPRQVRIGASLAW